MVFNPIHLVHVRAFPFCRGCHEVEKLQPYFWNQYALSCLGAENEMDHYGCQRLGHLHYRPLQGDLDGMEGSILLLTQGRHSRLPWAVATVDPCGPKSDTRFTLLLNVSHLKKFKCAIHQHSWPNTSLQDAERTFPERCGLLHIENSSSNRCKKIGHSELFGSVIHLNLHDNQH